MEMIRTWLRAWLGINSQEKRIEDLENPANVTTLADVSRKQFEIDTAIRELKEIQAQIRDPRSAPILARTTRQFKQLMEQE